MLKKIFFGMLILILGVMLALTLAGCDFLTGDDPNENGPGGNNGGASSTVDNATSITVGYSSSHTISQNGKQWFKFVGTGGTVIFETTGNAVDTYMAIWNNHGDAKNEYSYNGRVGSDDNSGEWQNALVSLNTTSGTTYFIRITSQNSTSGTYTFAVTASTANERHVAIPITDGYSSSHTISTNGQHWFIFQGTGETVILEIVGNVVTANIDIYVGNNTSSTFNEKNRVSFTTISGTTYYIRITGNSGTYIFNVYNGFGDSSSPSFSIPVTVGYSSSHTISQSGKQWFSFLGTGNTIVFQTTGNAVDTYMAIWNNHGDAKNEYSYNGRVGSDDNNGEGYNALVTLNTTSGTTYFIRITPVSNTSGTYTFVVQ